MNVVLLNLPALLVAGLAFGAPVSEWYSPGFVASISPSGIEMRGHVPSAAVARRLEERVNEAGAKPEMIEFERHVLLPDWWAGLTIELVPLLASLHSGEARLTREGLEFEGLAVAGSTFRQDLRSLQRSLPAGLDLTDSVSVLPVDRKASICRRLFSSLSDEPLLFEHGVSEPPPSYHGRLNRLAAALRRCPEARVRIAGHSDNFGTRAGNLETSRARARIVASFLRSRGVDQDRLDVEAFGDAKPVATNATWAGRNQNRRVKLSVLK